MRGPRSAGEAANAGVLGSERIDQGRSPLPTPVSGDSDFFRRPGGKSLWPAQRDFPRQGGVFSSNGRHGSPVCSARGRLFSKRVGRDASIARRRPRPTRRSVTMRRLAAPASAGRSPTPHAAQLHARAQGRGAAILVAECPTRRLRHRFGGRHCRPRKCIQCTTGRRRIRRRETSLRRSERSREHTRYRPSLHLHGRS